MKVEYSKRAVSDIRQVAAYQAGPAIRRLLSELQRASKRSREDHIRVQIAGRSTKQTDNDLEFAARALRAGS